MYSAEPTGVERMGVVVGVWLLLIMLLRSKSQMRTGVTYDNYTVPYMSFENGITSYNIMSIMYVKITIHQPMIDYKLAYSFRERSDYYHYYYYAHVFGNGA
jgi:hypothetical protein